jgi:membrane protein YqaA with SNARE-associated domain
MLQFIEQAGYSHSHALVKQLFDKWGFWAVLVAGATPIPYKVFTIGAGLLKFNFSGFILGSMIGRGIRFFLVSCVMKFGGNKIDQICRDILAKHSKKLFIVLTLLIAVYIVFYKGEKIF